jgi:competence protein ComEA
VARRAARVLALLAVLAALPARVILETPPRPRSCPPEGRGAPPRGWLGCAADEGPRRALSGEERLVLGLPLDINRATARELGFVAGLTPRLGRAIVDDRTERGPFRSVEELDRVRGIGPRRLARARGALTVAP